MMQCRLNIAILLQLLLLHSILGFVLKRQLLHVRRLSQQHQLRPFPSSTTAFTTAQLRPFPSSTTTNSDDNNDSISEDEEEIDPKQTTEILEKELRALKLDELHDPSSSSFVDISFDSASNKITLIFDGDIDDPVQASASDMMSDQGISEVRAKDNSIPRGINMDTLVSNKKMVGGSIKFGEQIFRINSSTNVDICRETELLKNGEFVCYHRGKFDIIMINHYEDRASSFEVQEGQQEQTNIKKKKICKNPNYRMFLGASGSGKSFSSLKHPFEYQTDCEHCLTVYLAASEVIRSFNEGDFDENDPQKKKGWVFISRVHNLLKDIIHVRLPQNCKKGKLENMILHLVLDEAGFREVDIGDFCWSVDDVNRLCEEITSDLVKDVKVTAAGTNLDHVTCGIVDTSDESVLKYRAKPWDSNNALATVTGILKTLQKKEPSLPWPSSDSEIKNAERTVKAWIESVSIYSSLLTNGRAAYSLISELLCLYKDKRDGSRLVQFVVDSVTKYYIALNGLVRLKPVDKRIVVKAILEVLTGNDIEEAVPVKFQLPDDKQYLLMRCLCIVDSNIEKSNNTYKYINEQWKCSYTVSPCATIVLFELLGFASALAINWESFETICELGLIQNTVINTEVDVDFRRIKMTTPFPGSNAERNSFVPSIQPNDIIRNGPRSSHGDVFAKNEIVLSKHSLNRDTVKISILEELYKCGLLKDDISSINSAITTLLHRQWNTKNLANNVNQSTSSIEEEENNEPKPTRRNRWYPASLLECEHNDDYNVVHFYCKEKDTEGGYTFYLENDESFEIKKEFNPAITFSICTNANEIELCLDAPCRNNDLEEFLPEVSEKYDVYHITPKDVDLSGKLIDQELRNIMGKFIKKGVDLQFHFCRGV